MQRANDAALTHTNEVDQITAWMEGRYYWGDILAELRQALIRSEEEIGEKICRAICRATSRTKQGWKPASGLSR